MLKKAESIGEAFVLFRLLRRRAVKWRVIARERAGRIRRLSRRISDLERQIESISRNKDRRIDELTIERDDAKHMANLYHAEIEVQKVEIDGLVGWSELRQQIDKTDAAISEARRLNAQQAYLRQDDGEIR